MKHQTLVEHMEPLMIEADKKAVVICLYAEVNDDGMEHSEVLCVSNITP